MADLQHYTWKLAFDGKLSLVPITPSIKRVLDVGTGTGRLSFLLQYKRKSLRPVHRYMGYRACARASRSRSRWVRSQRHPGTTFLGLSSSLLDQTLTDGDYTSPSPLPQTVHSSSKTHRTTGTLTDRSITSMPEWSRQVSQTGDASSTTAGRILLLAVGWWSLIPNFRPEVSRAQTILQ